MVDGRIIDTDAVDLDDEKVKTMTRAMILCNDSSCKDGVEIGDPTETALSILAQSLVSTLTR